MQTINFKNGSLVAHRGGIVRGRADLATLHTPEATPTWTPVPHADLVGSLLTGLAAAGVTVTKDQYVTLGRDDARLFGVMDLVLPTVQNSEFGMALGLRTSNDKSLALEVTAAARVFVCDNMAFSGSGGSVCLKRKHTGRLRLDREIPHAIELFLDKSGHWAVDLERMHEVALTDARSKELIYDAFTASRQLDRALPVRLIEAVHTLYFEDDQQRAKFPDRTLWSLNNAFTEAVKSLPAASQYKHGRRIGSFFAKRLVEAVGRGGHDGASIVGGFAGAVVREGRDTIEIELPDEPVVVPDALALLPPYEVIVAANREPQPVAEVAGPDYGGFDW
jgi:hypothetical protein